MPSAAFDTHAAIKTLREANFDEAQAEAAVAMVRDAITEGGATGRDILELKNDHARLEGKIDGIKGEINGLEGKIDGIKGEINGVKTGLSFIKWSIIGVMMPVTVAMLGGIGTIIGTLLF